MAELKNIISKWNHERDRAVYQYPDGREQVLYDGGCKFCRRCQVEDWIRRHEKSNERQHG
jgi:hypothetical protein